MTTLEISLKNCYGIKKLDHKFTFSETHSTYAIYASNGSMKTSFAKTFERISEGKQPEDLVYSERETTCKINFDNQDIQPAKIFVIHSYSKNYESSKISTLLANKELRKKYEDVYKEINSQKTHFLKELKKVCGVVKLEEIERKISRVFYNNEANKFFESLERIKAEINENEASNYKGIRYKDIFDDKVKIFLDNAEVQKNISEYIKKYDELLEGSTYFKKGIFNHSQAEETAKQLKKNGFFKASHAVLFGDKKLATETELTEVINAEKNSILKNETLKTVFDKLDSKINTDSLRKFREFLSTHTFVIAELQNLESFEAKLWKYYIKEKQDIFNNLLALYSAGRQSISEISKQAKKEETKWLNAIKIFNERFEVPFEVTISNKVDVILKEETPSISFEFVEKKDRKNMTKKDLLEVLSQGEKRALYLLDIIFEIEARKTEGGKHLFIIDDIADSFDYKNKYAIIEYLKDISKIDGFYQIVLSHNFDFHRTISSRLAMKRANKLNVLKSGNNSIELKKEHYQNNPFDDWRNRLDNQYFVIASIPFVRNIAGYIGNTDSNTSLTSFLHIKEGTENLTVADLKKEFAKVLYTGHDKIGNSDNFIHFLTKATNDIFTLSASDRELEHKIVLAISIRLSAEKFMIKKIDDADYVRSIDKYQTAKLLDKYKEVFSIDIANIKILDKVQLMTPESIHLNSFMFEPLLDMSDEYLITLSKEVAALQL